jgi:hypothetical protein
MAASPNGAQVSTHHWDNSTSLVLGLLKIRHSLPPKMPKLLIHHCFHGVSSGHSILHSKKTNIIMVIVTKKKKKKTLRRSVTLLPTKKYDNGTIPISV